MIEDIGSMLLICFVGYMCVSSIGHFLFMVKESLNENPGDMSLQALHRELRKELAVAFLGLIACGVLLK